jgi:hypothetical protein
MNARIEDARARATAERRRLGLPVLAEAELGVIGGSGPTAPHAIDRDRAIELRLLVGDLPLA